MSNLIIFCDRSDLAERIQGELPAIVARHPARILLLIAEAGTAKNPTMGTVRVPCRRGVGEDVLCSEQVTLRAQGAAIEDLPFAVRELVLGDLPVNLWWAAPQPPSLAGPLLYELSDQVQQIIYDSLGWLEPHRGVAATAAWLANFEQAPTRGRWRVASDLNWRRLKHWRRGLAQALDPAATPGALNSITEVLVEHGPHAVTQAWQLVGWLAGRLQWRVQAARIQPGVEISWEVIAPHGSLRLCIHRLPEGPPEVRRVRIGCTLDGKAGTLDCVVGDDRRLAVVLVGSSAAPRTMTVQPSSLAEMVTRQLSDREPDPVFRDSMAVAQVFAESVLG